MKKYDVIIVGAGPAGVSAAKVLKDKNINFCIIDKNKFPREKLCGGGLTNKSINLLKKLNFNMDNINKIDVSEVDFYAKNIKRNMKLYNEIIMIDRVEFDYNNLKQVINDNLYENESITSIEDNILITNKGKYEFKYIIFADGLNGYSRKLIKNRRFGFCLEYNSNVKTNKTVLDFTAIIGGYGWVFPKVNHTTIGIGKFDDKKADYIKLLYSFANKYNFKIDKTKIKGYHIPLFSKEAYKKSVINNKYIIVGDAASLVDHISGEGIYYALLSGMKAAESIICSLDSNENLKDIYFNKTKGMYKSLCKRKFLSKLLYSKCGLFFIKLGLSNKFFIKKINKMFG